MRHCRHPRLSKVGIHFAAVHERNSWRKHSQHQTLVAATTGDDGAENLLLNRNRAPAMLELHGQAHAVFVWDEGEQAAHAFRLKPGSESEIERALVPAELLSGFKRGAGPSQEEIERFFASHAIDGEAKAKQSQPLRRQYRYGDRPTWELVFDAVRAFGRPATPAEVGDSIVSLIPSFARANLAPDLSVLSVNCNSRGNHGVNRKPRRTDEGNPYDRLIRIGRGRGVLFDVYKPRAHGVWALVHVGEKVLRPRFIGGADGFELESARDAATAAGMFDPTEDARRRIMAAIVQRDGQPAFRKALLAAYQGACAISGCSVEALLEAAHVVPYRGTHTNMVGNGLLLRADLHKMFDLHMFFIDPSTRKVRLSGMLRRSEYAYLEGVALRQPVDPSMAVLDEVLEHHKGRCGWMHAGPDGAPLDAL